MKHLKGILRLFAFVLLLFQSSGSKVLASNETERDRASHIDSVVTLSLLTCQPGGEAYSLYGHTAIHYVNKEKGLDIAVNYGMFNFHKPYFVLRFIFGLTDYEMGIQPFDYFCAAYAYERRGIIEQELNLHGEEKQAIVEAIEKNYRPENREYRYNIFYDNCTTRARDMLLRVFKEDVPSLRTVSIKRQDKGPSFRELTHKYTKDRPWAQLGNDLLLGLKADCPTTISEQQFLPDNLKQDFDEATILSKDNQKAETPLVKEKRIVVPVFENEVKKEFPLSPIGCAILLAGLILAITAYEYKYQKMLWGFDLVLLLLIGLSGLILTAMIFSQHPTVNLNLQILLLNPLALIFLWPVIRHEAKGRGHWFWMVYAICLLLFLAGNVLQHYAEGTNIVALSLLIRSIKGISNQSNQNIRNNQKNQKTNQ